MVEVLMRRYQAFSVTYEHATDGSEERRVNRTVLTVYGESEFAIQAELQRQHPTFTNIVILEVAER